MQSDNRTTPGTTLCTAPRIRTITRPNTTTSTTQNTRPCNCPVLHWILY